MSKKLLLIEDDLIAAHDMRRIALDLGYTTITNAKSIEELINSLKNELPDLVLVSSKNNFSSPLELLKIIEKKYHLPYIYLTHYKDDAVIEIINQTNPLGYILKPFDERSVKVALTMAFNKLASSNQSPKTISTKIVRNVSGEKPIIGDSSEINNAITKVNQVAATNVTVLLQGETGTGKELFMEAIHKASSRSNKPVVKVNCAALPTDLIESVLFGHEKGSFTGASEKRIGKFEFADGGTIFLDEISELPLTGQAKLLRCLQEKEIETIGSNTYKKVDVRIIAATNRDLSQAVKDGKFRTDLFFRLNIFPIEVPALRNRKDDIPLLANYFLQESIKRLNKPIKHISPQTLKDFMHHDWPGNVRELQHYIERGVITSETDELTLNLQSSVIIVKPKEQRTFELKSLEEAEREQIMLTLQYCNGKIRGNGGAAEILKLHPNTLDFKIKKLGITKQKVYKQNIPNKAKSKT